MAGRPAPAFQHGQRGRDRDVLLLPFRSMAAGQVMQPIIVADREREHRRRDLVDAHRATVAVAHRGRSREHARFGIDRVAQRDAERTPDVREFDDQRLALHRMRAVFEDEVAVAVGEDRLDPRIVDETLALARVFLERDRARGIEAGQLARRLHQDRIAGFHRIGRDEWIASSERCTPVERLEVALVVDAHRIGDAGPVEPENLRTGRRGHLRLGCGGKGGRRDQCRHDPRREDRSRVPHTLLPALHGSGAALQTIVAVV